MPSVGNKRRCTQRRRVHKEAARARGRGAQTATDELLLNEFYFSLIRLLELGILSLQLFLENREREWLAAPPRVVLPKAATALGVVVP